MAYSNRLLNRVAVITGASSGLGRAIAVRYAREGAKVVCSDLGPSARREVPEESKVDTHDLIQGEGGKATFVKADVGEVKDMEELVGRAAGWGGRLDIMVNNAGISHESKNPLPLHETPNEFWDSAMRINGKSVFLGCKYAIKQMLKQDALPSGDRGWIINMSSIFGLVGGNNNSTYAASKGAVTNLTRQVALDYAQHSIRCNGLCPGYTKTAIFADTTANLLSEDVLERRHPLGGPGVPDDIAKMAVVLASEDASWLTGCNIPVDGGYTAR